MGGAFHPPRAVSGPSVRVAPARSPGSVRSRSTLQPTSPRWRKRSRLHQTSAIPHRARPAIARPQRVEQAEHVDPPARPGEFADRLIEEAWMIRHWAGLATRNSSSARPRTRSIARIIGGEVSLLKRPSPRLPGSNAPTPQPRVPRPRPYPQADWQRQARPLEPARPASTTIPKPQAACPKARRGADAQNQGQPHRIAAFATIWHDRHTLPSCDVRPAHHPRLKARNRAHRAASPCKAGEFCKIGTIIAARLQRLADPAAQFLVIDPSGHDRTFAAMRCDRSHSSIRPIHYAILRAQSPARVRRLDRKPRRSAGHNSRRAGRVRSKSRPYRA